MCSDFLRLCRCTLGLVNKQHWKDVIREINPFDIKIKTARFVIVNNLQQQFALSFG